MIEPTKSDYEKARDVWAARVINIEAELTAAKAGFQFCAEKVKGFPDDPMPEDLKKDIKEVSK